MTEHLTSTSWVIFYKALSVNVLCPAQFVKCPTKRTIWKDICPVNKEKLFPALNFRNLHAQIRQWVNPRANVWELNFTKGDTQQPFDPPLRSRTQTYHGFITIVIHRTPESHGFYGSGYSVHNFLLTRNHMDLPTHLRRYQQRNDYMMRISSVSFVILLFVKAVYFLARKNCVEMNETWNRNRFILPFTYYPVSYLKQSFEGRIVSHSLSRTIIILHWNCSVLKTKNTIELKRVVRFE